MLKAGWYYVGDLCYVLKERAGFDWHEILSATNYFRPSGYFEYKGIKFFCSSTMWGDGAYQDQDGRTYLVDAGVIGCFPRKELADDLPEDFFSGGQLIKFETDFHCTPCPPRASSWLEDSGLGMINIGHIEIQTGDDPEEDFYGWESEEEDYD